MPVSDRLGNGRERATALIELDQQVVSRRCDACETDFKVVRGSVYRDGVPFALYLTVLHGHSLSGKVAHLAVGIKEGETKPPVAIAMHVSEAPEHFAFSLCDWSASPWAAESYLGRMLDRDAALGSPAKGAAFEIAEHVVQDLPDVRAYFLEPDIR